MNFDNILSITRVNQNFSNATKKTDEKGTIIILKSNQPRYVLMTYEEYLKLKKKRINDEA